MTTNTPESPITVTVDHDPRGISVGVWQGSHCIYSGAHPLPAAPGVSTVESDAVTRLRDAIEGECGGTWISEKQAIAVLAHLGGNAPAAGDALDALPPLDADLIEILGRPNFRCGGIAARLRADGHDIKRKSEHEQAATIHFLLGHYLKHGTNWRETAGSALDAIAAQRKGDA